MDNGGATEPMLNTSDEVAVLIEESQQDGESNDLPLEIFREEHQGARASRLTRSPGRYTNTVKTNMHQAAEVGDANRLLQLIQERPDHLSQQDENGHVPLHLAARGVHLECCKVLLSASIKEVNVKDKLGNTPLLLALTTGDMSFKIAELLVFKGASVKTANRAKRTALHLAAEKGNDEILTLLVSNCPESVHAREAEQQTPLHLAARCGHVTSCRLLVGNGADKEAKDLRGYTALHWAAKMGFSECCSQLLKLGSEVNCSDKVGNTPLHLICSSSKEKPGCVEVLFKYRASPAIQNNKGETPFHCAQYSPGEVRKLFEAHPDIDLFIADNKGKTVLHCAAERKKSRNVEFILAMAKSQNVNMKQFVNMPDSGGKTALYVAIEGGDLECCKSLVKAGADGNLVLGARGTSLHLAAEKGLREVCEYLITKGIKTDTRNSSLMTPLHLAAKNGHASCCEVLLKRGVPWAAQDDQGMTALHHAAKEERAECCRVIVALQPSAVTRTDKAGQTPLHFAVEKNCLECCQALVTPRSDIWCQSNGKSPIKYAYEKRFHQIFDFLLNTENVEKKKRTERDIDFRDLLEESLEHISSASEDEDNVAHRHIAKAIIHSCFWEESLKSYGTPGDLTPPEKQKNGNLRLLVKHLPDEAKMALDKCMAKDGSMEGAHQRGYIVRYLDQEYFVGVNPKKAKGTYTLSRSGEQLTKGVRVGGVSRAWREDHVVAWMTRYERHGLLQHPLVTRWLDYKWQSYVSYGLYACIVLASVLALLLTVFTAISWDWSYLKQEYNYTQDMVCAFESEKIVGPEVETLLRRKGHSPLVLSYIIVALLALWAVHDLYSFAMLRKKYFTKENVAFLACAIASVVFVMNFSHCSQLTYVRETEMHQAAEAGDEIRLRRLLEEMQKDISKQDENGLTPLHLAAKKTRLRCCQILLDVSHKEINVKDRSGNTPLLLCISNKPGSFETAKLLISEGANVNSSNKAKLTALHTAAERGNLEVLHLLLLQKDIALNSEDSERHTPLHLASKAGHWKICQTLLLAGADVATCNVHGQTPLHIAAKMGFSECGKHLLSAGGVNSPDAQGNTALHLLCASGKNSPECARVLFEGGASADSENKKGETPFHVAQFSRFDVKKTFQHQEVDLFLRDASGSTALHYAADRRESKHVELILLMARERSLDVVRLVNVRNEAGMTALHVAIARGERDSCRALLKAGADATISCESLGPPISMASQTGLQDICDILTEK